MYRDYIKEPFAIWAVFERLAGLDEDHGPIRFSLLYICGEGAATFQALYYGSQCAPAVVAIIQPGMGFGSNWTDFTHPKEVLARSVLENPCGSPGYLLYGGWGNDYRTPCWPKYSKLVHYWGLNVPGALGLWSVDDSRS